MGGEVLRNYVAGRWVTPTGEGRPVLDASTGEEVVRVATGGVDVAAALEHARRRGGPALQALTFHQRAGLLGDLAGALTACREELYALSARAGSTLADARVDVDGGIGVLRAYARLGRRELPDDTVVCLDGEAVRLGRGGGFVGQHLLSTRPGVAVQVNAFNFPVWGPLEKLAPALLAGVPSLVKPATPTAYITARLVEQIVASGLLPDGALQLVCGTPPGLFDHLGEQDSVSFTGSASTAAALRCHPGLVGASVRFSAEADSLNCSVLGPDAEVGTPELDLYVEQLVTEMRVKAGQKCTAIRRALVPTRLLGEVAAAVSERLARVVVGPPGDDGVGMGPLVSVGQREEVRRAVSTLLRAGRVVAGDPAGDGGGPGAFYPPLLLACDDPARDEPHQVEAFGPVATLIGYDDEGGAVDAIRRGRGSLVASVVSADADFVERTVRAVAAWHGRILVLDRDDAAESTGHGSPLPLLTHGGPGRAGGGEELGGLRAVFAHLQRCALQGSPQVVSTLSKRWVPGADRRDDGVHPFRKSLAELAVGDSVTVGPRQVTLADIEHFASFTGDTFYAHTDEEAARANPFFEGRVAHGYLILSFAAGMFVQPDPGPVLANYGLESLRFQTPVSPGDEITVALTCKQITPRADADYGEVRWAVQVTNGAGETVATYDLLTLVASTWPPTGG